MAATEERAFTGTGPAGRGAERADTRTRTERWLSSPLVAALPAVIVVGTVALRFVWENAYHFGTKEDGFAEYLTALAYLLVCGMALVVAWKVRRAAKVMAAGYLLLGLGAFFVAGEEVSWGQRILGFAGPEELVSMNNQSEANLHNLLGATALHSVYIAVGLYGAWLARPIVTRIGWLRPVDAFVPPTWSRPWFASAAVFYLYVEIVDRIFTAVGGPTLWDLDLVRVQEVVELILAVGFLMFVAHVLGRVRRGGAAMGHSPLQPISHSRQAG